MRKTIAFAFENINCDKFFINIYAGYLYVRQTVELRREPLDQPKYNSVSDIKSLYAVRITRRLKIL